MEDVELVCRTWGSWGRHTRDYAILVDGTVIDACSLKYDKRVKIGGKEYAIRVEVNDSRKNLNRRVYVPREIVAPVLRHTHKHGWEIVEGEGSIIEKDETVVKEDGRYRRRIRYNYVDEKRGIRVELDRWMASVEKELVGNPLLKLYTTAFSGDLLLCVSGDTYNARSELKRLGYKWHPLDRAWCKRIASIAEVMPNDLDEMRRRKREVIEQLVREVAELAGRLSEYDLAPEATPKSILIDPDEMREVIKRVKTEAR